MRKGPVTSRDLSTIGVMSNVLLLAWALNLTRETLGSREAENIKGFSSFFIFFNFFKPRTKPRTLCTFNKSSLLNGKLQFLLRMIEND